MEKQSGDNRTMGRKNTVTYGIYVANFLLDQQLRTLEQEFVESGGFTERLYRARIRKRQTGI